MKVRLNIGAMVLLGTCSTQIQERLGQVNQNAHRFRLAVDLVLGRRIITGEIHIRMKDVDHSTDILLAIFTEVIH